MYYTQNEGPLTLDDLGGHVQHSAHCIGQSVLQFSGSSKVTQLQHTTLFEEENTVREVGRREKERKKGRERERGRREEGGREGGNNEREVREERTEGGREGGQGREAGGEAGREGGREEERERGRWRGRWRGREGGRERGVLRGIDDECHHNWTHLEGLMSLWRTPLLWMNSRAVAI